MKRFIFLLLSIFICLSFVGCTRIGANYKNVNINGYIYPQIKGEYDGDFSYETFTLKKIDREESLYCINYSKDYFVDISSQEYKELSKGKIVDYKEYKNICEEYSFSDEYDDKDSNYIIIMYAPEYDGLKFNLIDIESHRSVKIYYYETKFPTDNFSKGYFCVIPTKVSEDTTIELVQCYTAEEIEYRKYISSLPPQYGDKPVIYLYPENDDTKIDVSLELNDAELTCTYPKYNDGWSVVADRDGLIKSGGKEYNYLYWEGKYFGDIKINQGFCVKGSDTAEFLEEKLSELGLNRREANEFIVYWLPLMEQNEYNVISFDTAEYENHYKLNVNPKPDTVIRVFMTWYAADEKIDIEPQTITTPTREGFTVVEWGGSEIK